MSQGNISLTRLKTQQCPYDLDVVPDDHHRGLEAVAVVKEVAGSAVLHVSGDPFATEGVPEQRRVCAVEEAEDAGEFFSFKRGKLMGAFVDEDFDVALLQHEDGDECDLHHDVCDVIAGWKDRDWVGRDG
jgi:hypothetical protein